MEAGRWIDALIAETLNRKMMYQDGDLSQEDYERLRAAQTKKRRQKVWVEINHEGRKHRLRWKSHRDRVERFAKKHPDFFDSIDSVDHIEVPYALSEALINSPHGPYVIYMLSKNKTHMRRICRLVSPFLIHLEVLNIELSR